MSFPPWPLPTIIFAGPQEFNDRVGAFFTITAELAAEQARAAEKAVVSAADKAARFPR